jgi:hypothetical protein
LYQPGAGVWTAGPPTEFPHALQSAVTLRDGRIMIAGGYGGGPEIFNPTTNRWSPAGSARFRAFPVMEALADGTVLLAAGVGMYGHALTSSRIYDPASGRWTAGGPLKIGRDLPVSSMLPDGRVLVAGGGGPNFRQVRSAEVFDPKTARWMSTAPLREARSDATATLLRNGAVLVCGGNLYSIPLDTCEEYHS